MHVGSEARYRALGARAASNLGPGVQALGNNHDLGFLVSAIAKTGWMGKLTCADVLSRIRSSALADVTLTKSALIHEI